MSRDLARGSQGSIMNERTSKESRFSSRAIVLLVISLAATIFLIIGLFFHWGFLAGVEYFKYPYREWLGFKNLIPAALFALLLLLFFTWGHRKGSQLRFLFPVIITAYLFQLAVSSAGPHGISGIGLVISDPGITSYFEHASELRDLSLAQYPELMEKFFMHARTHPPGPILFIQWILNFFEYFPSITSVMVQFLLLLGVSPAIFDLNPHSHIVTVYTVGFILPFIGCLASLVIYLFVRHIEDKGSAFIASTLFLISPAMSLFLPEFDQILAFFAIITLAAGWYSFERNKVSYALLAGFSLFIATFFQLLCLCLLPMLFLAWSLLKWKRSVPIDFKGSSKIFFSFLLGWIIPFIVLQIAYGFSIIRVFQKVLGLSQMILDKAPPPGIDFLHFCIFLGVPTSILLLSAWFSRGNVLSGKIDSQNILSLSFLILLLALSSSGKVRAETGRLWIFLMPVASSIAGIELRRLSRNKVFIILIFLLLVLFSLFALRGKLAVLHSPIYGRF